MNFLAHIYLSGNDSALAIGNFIGDFVKGQQMNAYPDRVREGILLHRAIDSFTDNHPVEQEAKHFMANDFGRYAGIFLDMFYDYLLASDFGRYSALPLRQFSRRFYKNMIKHYAVLPTEVKGFMPHFISTNRLYKYSTKKGLGEALTIMGNHSSLPQLSSEAIAFLTKHEEYLRNNFNQFFPELITFVEETAKLKIH